MARITGRVAQVVGVMSIWVPRPVTSELPAETIPTCTNSQSAVIWIFKQLRKWVREEKVQRLFIPTFRDLSVFHTWKAAEWCRKMALHWDINDGS